ncbi:MAG: hypothetical protein ACYCQJ_06300 [Nitrososphaerales archaeon]
MSKEEIPIKIPQDVWQPLVEIRAELDALCPGSPTPIVEALREIVSHYKHCSKTQEEIDSFCKRAKKWK